VANGAGRVDMDASFRYGVDLLILGVEQRIAALNTR
jgi:hypothetical protein